MGDSNYTKGTRVYVGGLGDGIKKEDLETEFEKYGKLNSVWVAFNPPGFAFIEFLNKDEAESACDGLNGTELLGSKLRVEISRDRGRGQRGFRGGRGGRGFSGGRGGRGGFGGGDRGYRGSSRGGGGGRGRGRFDDYSSGGGGGRGSGYSRSYDRDGGRDGYSSGGGGRDSYSGRDSYGGGGGNSYDTSSRYRSRSPISRGR